MFSSLSVSTILGVVSILIILKLLRWIFQYIYQLWVYRHLDGPSFLPFIGNFLDFNLQKSELFRFYNGMIARNGKGKLFVYWLGTQPFVVLNKGDDLDAIFNDTRFMNKSYGYELIQPWLKTGLLTAGGGKWYNRRKLITPSFHFDILKDFLAIINEQSEIFIEKLKKLNMQDKVALKPYICAASLDIICETAMGVNVNSQKEENSSYFKAVQGVSDCLVYRMITPYLWPDYIFRFSSCYRRQKECLKVLHGFTRKIINERNEGFSGLSGVSRKRVAFLDTLLDARLKNPDSIDLDGIQEEVDTFMFEGHDTTTAALDFACFAIATHPEEQAKLQKEIDSVFGGSNRSVTDSDLNKLTYLECAIKESLRLYPPVTVIERSPSEDTMFCGHKLLKGTSIVVAINHVNRDERYYPEPTTFKPERFLHENCENRPAFAFIPFSAGRRNCIGQRFAMQELKVMLANILRNFKMECNQTYEELKAYSYLIHKSEVPIMIKLTQKEK